jgi:hypothetical protein
LLECRYWSAIAKPALVDKHDVVDQLLL